MKTKFNKSRVINRYVMTLFIFVLFTAISATPGMAKEMIIVGPSGDTTGVTDATTIENALRQGSVLLSDGDNNTVDTFYTNRVIVIEGFSGTLSGESRENTIWRMVKNDPPPPDNELWKFDSDYFEVPGLPDAGIWPTGLHLEFPGDWQLMDMTMIADNPLLEGFPFDPFFQYVAAWGGNGDSTIRNVDFIEIPETFARAIGPHIMRGSTRGSGSGIEGVGDVLISNCAWMNADTGPIIMWLKNSKVVLKDLETYDVRSPVFLMGFVDCNVAIKSCLFAGSNGPTISLRSTQNVTIKDNLFYDHDALGESWRAPIFIGSNSTNIVIKNNEFLDIRNVHIFRGAGAVLAGFGSSDITIKHNVYNDIMAVAIRIRPNVDGVVVCEKDLNDSQIIGAVNQCGTGD